MAGTQQSPKSLPSHPGANIKRTSLGDEHFVKELAAVSDENPVLATEHEELLKSESSFAELKRRLGSEEQKLNVGKEKIDSLQRVIASRQQKSLTQQEGPALAQHDLSSNDELLTGCGSGLETSLSERRKSRGRLRDHSDTLEADASGMSMTPSSSNLQPLRPGPREASGMDND